MLEIKEEFKKLIPPLTVEEFKQLEQNCLDEGIREKIITWNGFIIDGHNRYEIATRWNLEYKTESKHFENEIDVRIWMRNNQKGRRNLSKAWCIELELGNKEDLALKGEAIRVEKISHFRQVGQTLSLNDNVSKHNTQKEIAKAVGVSTGMVGMSEIVKAKSPELWEKAKQGEITVTTAYKEIKKEEKKTLTEEKKEEQKKIIESITNIKLKNIETTIEKGWYKVGKQFLYFGSNTDKEFIDKLPKAKFAFADPPYNAGVDKWDFDFKWELDYLENYADVVAVTPGGWNACNFYKETNMNYIWEMFCWITNGMTHGKCGYANVIKTSIFGKVKPKISQDFWKINIDISKTEDTKHKGRKPYDFMIHLIDLFTNENDIVIDVFGGSGTTMLMCEQMNRISYNAEIDKQYCIDIIKRIGNYERI
jgi:16S rRNA G966 N2-methylase RsmD